ncbi:MAG: AraC family transcriptional regulator [Nevskiaceae bacterium]|nr:MAG: AraC family transcriptional regulator [Nevskiaceae bacterium]TBR74691.1 MAG: AraC family transcriptional regulator [Nevskiaceae bacterium]
MPKRLPAPNPPAPKSPTPKSGVPFVTLTSWVRAAVHCGIDIEAVFREVRIPTDLMHLETAMVDGARLVALMDACVAAAARAGSAEHFPFVLGDSFVFDYLPDLGTFIETAPTLRAAARVFDWLPRFVNPAVQAQVVEDGAVARILLVDRMGVAPPYIMESWVASVVKFGRLLMRSDGDFKRLCFRYPPPAWASVYERFFHVPVVFGHPHFALDFDAVLLDAPRRGAFPALHEQARLRIEQRAAEFTGGLDLASLVERVLVRQPQLLQHGMGAVAAALKLHPRTLQRRLAARGQCYADVASRVRYRLAMQALDGAGADLDALGRQLGFSGRRSFTRAFVRWSGMTPAAYREHRPAHE